MSEAKPFNPTWLTAAVVVFVQVAGIGANWQANTETRAQVSELQAWRNSTERRIAENEKQVSTSNKGFEKDLAALQDGVRSIQQALMVRGSTPIITPMRGQQPYP
jgi:hypothetical protein